MQRQTVFHYLASFFPAVAILARATVPVLADEGAVADTIYSGGIIVTVNDAQPEAEAVAVKDGTIVAVGRSDDVMKHKGDATALIDLGGNTMTPGLIDAHSHFMWAVPILSQVNVSKPPVGSVESIADIITALKAYQEKFKPAAGEWILAYGYNADGLAEGRDLTRYDLDPHFPDNPVLVRHVSFHGAVLNGRAFETVGIDESTETPAGGIIARKEGSNEPAGLLMETAYLPILAKLPKPSEEEMLELIEAAQGAYASNGYTTVQDGAAHLHEVELLRKAAGRKRLFLDIVSLPLFTEIQKIVGQPGYTFGVYRDRLKLGGIKFVMDGSPQGRTAFFSKPFLTGGPDGQENWRGEPTMPQETYEKLVKLVLDHDLQNFTHANGDATVDMVIAAHRRFGVKAADDRRTVVVHSQFMRPEQLDSYKALGLTPSFFTNHAFFWGDVHVKNLGEERAFFLSPMQSAADKGIRFSNHTDFLVTPLDPMFTIWTAVTRQSRSGKVIGPDQRVRPLQALKALTLGAAYQYREEDRKGSIEPGKLADLVVLSANPLTVDPDAIRDIQVLETIKEGKTIFRR